MFFKVASSVCAYRVLDPVRSVLCTKDLWVVSSGKVVVRKLICVVNLLVILLLDLFSELLEVWATVW